MEADPRAGGQYIPPSCPDASRPRRPRRSRRGSRRGRERAYNCAYLLPFLDRVAPSRQIKAHDQAAQLLIFHRDRIFQVMDNLDCRAEHFVRNLLLMDELFEAVREIVRRRQPATIADLLVHCGHSPISIPHSGQSGSLAIFSTSSSWATVFSPSFKPSFSSIPFSIQ